MTSLNTRRRAGLATTTLATWFALGPAFADPLVFDEGACGYVGAAYGHTGHGVLVEFVTSDRADRMMAASQARAHATLNPRFVASTRALLTLPDGRRMAVVLPDKMIAKPGDEVTFVSGHRDWSLPCGYIPNLVTGFLHSRKATR